MVKLSVQVVVSLLLCEDGVLRWPVDPVDPSARCVDAACQCPRDLATGETHEIKPGVMYALNLHDKHTLRAEEDLHMACCFNPPVTGKEVHREDGSYAPAEEVA